MRRAKSDSHQGALLAFRVALRVGLCAVLPTWLAMHAGRALAAEPGSLSLRASAALATLTTADQIGYLHYDRQGLVGTLHFGYALLPWLDARLGMAGGGFLSSSDPTGGLLAPNTGLVAQVTGVPVLPYASFDAGAAITGKLVRPFAQLGLGADFPIGHGLALGPYLGHGRVFQTHEKGASSDAGYLFVGLSLAFRTERPKRIAHRAPSPLATPRIVQAEDSAEPYEPPDPPVSEPSPILLELLDQAVPSARTELLAPVLFAFDSDALEPIGVAMLHEVARMLEQRRDLELVEIAGYADQRGGSDYNRELSDRRARRVMAWLIEHGIAAERLTVAAQGASGFVESGASELAHEQNRRVVFRVLREAEK
jgi:outer membrane protein OmpA-like peptidoglycan-associated protein/drug/metabolite transporter superfamily protein YnfA